LQVGNFIRSKLKVGFGVGKVVTHALRVVGLSSNWVVAVNVVCVDLTGHRLFLVR
jgi:hypothetical protein